MTLSLICTFSNQALQGCAMQEGKGLHFNCYNSAMSVSSVVQDFQHDSVHDSFDIDLPPHMIIQSSIIKLTETIGQGLQKCFISCSKY